MREFIYKPGSVNKTLHIFALKIILQIEVKL